MIRSEMNVCGSKPTPARANTRPITYASNPSAYSAPVSAWLVATSRSWARRSSSRFGSIIPTRAETPNSEISSHGSRGPLERVSFTR